MKPLKVKELHQMLGDIIKAGGGDKTLYVTTDEEGNDYRKMWFTPLTDADEIKEFLSCTMSGLSNCDDVNDAVVIG